MYKDPNEDEQEQLIKQGPSCWERMFYNTKFQIILVLILCAFIGVGTPFIWQLIWSITKDCCRIESDLRYDCYPLQDEPHKNESFCREKAHCCWDNDTTPDQIQCYYGMVTKNDESSKMPGYTVFNFTEKEAVLRVDKLPRYFDKNNNDSIKGPLVRPYLSLKVEHFSADHFHVKIGSLNPEDDNGYDLYKEFNLDKSVPYQTNESKAEISWKSKSNSSMFSLSVKRKDSGHFIFNTGDFSPFIYAKAFIEITTLLPNDLIYGLGQSPSKSFKHNMTYPDDWQIFSQHNLNLTTNQSSWFGSHPFYMGWTNDDKAYGILLLNSYPLQLITNSRPSLTFRTIGGPLDFHFFLGPTPADVYKQLIAMIGKPSLPPYWALGFHMCRTNNDLKDPFTGADTIVKNMRSLGIPFDSDCGSASMSSVSAEGGSTAGLNIFYKNLSTTYKVSALVVQVPHKLPDDANWNGAVLTKPNGDIYHGRFYDWLNMDSEKKYTKVHPNISVKYPSFEFENNIVRNALINEYGKFGDISGTFLDYNTPLDLSSTLGLNMSVLCPTLIEKNIWNQYHYWKLNEYNPCLDSVDPFHQSIDAMSTHNLYGHRHMKAVKTVLESSTQRKLVISLSTFIGDGAYGGHIGTNMNATWDMLLQTHIQTLEFNMYGMPLVGFPVCGFKGKSSDEELCLRWYQLAALQPFMISHRGFGQSLTDPFSVTQSNSTREAIKSSILIRYRLLPYLYTLFYKAHTEGEPVVRPLFYEFPEDKKTFRIDKQYLLGSALMASPVTKNKAKSVEAYFPKDKKGSIWYDYYSGRRIAAKEGQTYNLSAIEYHINLHLRGGYVIATQPPGYNTEESRAKPYQLIAGLDLDKHAEGDLYIDDGKTNGGIAMTPTFTVEANNLTIITNSSNYLSLITLYNPRVDMIKIYGVIDNLKPEYFNVSCCPSNQQLNCPEPHQYTKKDYIHDPYSGVLTLRNLQINFVECDMFVIYWNHQDYTKLSEVVENKP